MEPKTIVAIEIASSKIKGGVATVGPDGMTVLAVEELPGIGNVRYGRVQNIREVSGMVNEIIRKLEKAPAVSPRSVKAAVISLGGRSLTATPAKSGLKFPNECEITENHIARLEYEASQNVMLDKTIVETVPRMFYVNRTATPKPVGTFGETVQGEFMFITCAKETAQNLDRLKFEKVDHDSIKVVLRPTAVGDMVLTPDERELGCALVDFGAETTTVSVYKDGSLAFLSVIPMGSRLITLDLMSGLGLTEEAAENYKITLGTLGEVNNAENTNAQEVNAYVRARAGEIAANILNQIERSGYTADDLSKIILVGGGSRLPEFATLLHNQCKMPVRMAEMPASVTFRVAGRNNANNIDIVAILAAGARTLPDSCLSEPVTIPEPVPFVEATEEEEETDVREEPVAAQPTIDRLRRAQPVYTQRGQRVSDDDDKDLMSDDPDEGEEQETDNHGKKGFSFFGIGRKKKKEDKFKDDYDEEEEYEEEYDEEEGVPYTDEDEIEEEKPRTHKQDDDHYNETKNRINSLRDRIVGFFNGTDIDEDEDN